MLKKQKGFTLIELLVVLSFIGIFVAVTVNFSIRNKDRWALRDTAREITSIYYQAKQMASRESVSLRLDIRADCYGLYRQHGSSWDDVLWIKKDFYPKKITASSTANFLINPMGFILIPSSPPVIAGAQIITLEAPRGAGKDTMTITIYPYGGLHVEKVFK